MSTACCSIPDAVQAYTQVPIDVEAMNIDMLSASAHKIHGPKGIGFLYIRRGVKIRSFVHGGAQERRRRAGTENVPGIIGFAKAAEVATKNMEEITGKERKVRDYLIARIEKEIPYARLNGDREKRLPNNVNFCFRFIEGESMSLCLTAKESVHPAALPAHRVLWTRLMCCLPLDFRMRSRTARFVLVSVMRQRQKKQILL